MMPPTLILDTNILVAGLRSRAGASHALLRAVAGGCFELGLTASLVLEYESILKRPGLVPVPPAEIDVSLDYLCGVGKCRPVRFRVRPAATTWCSSGGGDRQRVPGHAQRPRHVRRGRAGWDRLTDTGGGPRPLGVSS